MHDEPEQQPTECRICGIGIRAEDDTIEVDGERLHVDCAQAHKEPRRRKFGWSMAMGSRGQMGMGEPQRDFPT